MNIFDIKQLRYLKLEIFKTQVWLTKRIKILFSIQIQIFFYRIQNLTLKEIHIFKRIFSISISLIFYFKLIKIKRMFNFKFSKLICKCWTLLWTSFFSTFFVLCKCYVVLKLYRILPGKYGYFPVWLSNRLISAGLEPVPSHTENSLQHYSLISFNIRSFSFTN